MNGDVPTWLLNLVTTSSAYLDWSRVLIPVTGSHTEIPIHNTQVFTLVVCHDFCLNVNNSCFIRT
jgi:hypothetical protein